MLKVKNEVVSELVIKKYEITNLQMTINKKLDQAHKLEGKECMKNEALKGNQQLLEDDAIKFIFKRKRSIGTQCNTLV